MAIWLLTILLYPAAFGVFTVLLAVAAEASSALFDLEPATKGNGILSDGARAPKFLTKVVPWLFGS